MRMTPRVRTVPGTRARSTLTAVCAGVLGLWVVACGAGRGAARSPAPTSVGDAAPPPGGLAFPGLDVEWTPPMSTAGDEPALSAALSLRPEVTLQLGPRLAGAGWHGRVSTLVAALAPGTKISGQRSGEVSALLDGAALQSPQRVLGPEGRPRYTTPPLRATWPEGQVGWVLAIDDAAVRASEWRSLPAVSHGTCEPAMQALAAGQERALVQLGPFLDGADAQLEAAYRARLAKVVPALLRALGTEDAGESAAKQRCARAYRAYVQRQATCVAGGACREAPRLVLLGGARIAALGPTPEIGRDCATWVGRDPVAEISEVARAAATATSARLSREWVVLADRLGALAEVYAALEDVCTPRRRRFAAADLAEARRRLARIGVALASPDLGAGRWQHSGQALVIPGLGAAQELLRFEPGASSVNAGIVADARALRDFVIGRSLCRSGHADAPLAVVLAAAGAGVSFFGYFYEEELLCGDLPPLGRGD